MDERYVKRDSIRKNKRDNSEFHKLNDGVDKTM